MLYLCHLRYGLSFFYHIKIYFFYLFISYQIPGKTKPPCSSAPAASTSRLALSSSSSSGKAKKSSSTRPARSSSTAAKDARSSSSSRPGKSSSSSSRISESLPPISKLARRSSYSASSKNQKNGKGNFYFIVFFFLIFSFLNSSVPLRSNTAKKSTGKMISSNFNTPSSSDEPELVFSNVVDLTPPRSSEPDAENNVDDVEFLKKAIEKSKSAIAGSESVLEDNEVKKN